MHYILKILPKLRRVQFLTAAARAAEAAQKRLKFQLLAGLKR